MPPISPHCKDTDRTKTAQPWTKHPKGQRRHPAWADGAQSPNVGRPHHRPVLHGARLTFFYDELLLESLRVLIRSNESSQELSPPIPATKIVKKKFTQQVDWQIASHFGSSITNSACSLLARAVARFPHPSCIFTPIVILLEFHLFACRVQETRRSDERARVCIHPFIHFSFVEASQVCSDHGQEFE